MKIANDILIPELARLLSEGKEVSFTPSGVSMRPFIEGDKDSVILAPPPASPKIGDILLARVSDIKHQTSDINHQTYVLHRLIRMEPSIHQASNIKHQTFILQGDGNLAGEESCLREDIIGRVVAIQTPSGRKKCLTRGRLWFYLRPLRKWLLKIYRHSYRKWLYD